MNKQTRQRITLNDELPDGLAVSPDGRKLYIRTSFQVSIGTTVHVLDITTRKLIGNPIAVRGGGAMVVSPDGRRLYMAGIPSVEILDTTQNAPLGTIDVGYADHVPGTIPELPHPTVSHDGRRLYVVTGPATVAMIKIDSGNDVVKWKLR